MTPAATAYAHQRPRNASRGGCSPKDTSGDAGLSAARVMRRGARRADCQRRPRTRRGSRLAVRVNSSRGSNTATTGSARLLASRIPRTMPTRISPAVTMATAYARRGSQPASAAKPLETRQTRADLPLGSSCRSATGQRSGQHGDDRRGFARRWHWSKIDAPTDGEIR